MRSFLLVLDWGWKVHLHIFALETETTYIYQKGEKLKQREIQEWMEASILLKGDVSPT
jgi:hypothetical protein